MISAKERRQPKRSAANIVSVSRDFVDRRVARHLTDLERSNYTESSGSANPYSGIVADADEEGGRGLDSSKRTKRETINVRHLLLYRKNLDTLIQESKISDLPPTTPSYLTAAAPKSAYPPLLLCSVCGYKHKYTCQRCGLGYCDLGCRAVHDETRCERRS